MKVEKRKIGIALIILVSVCVITGMFILDPIAQDIEYHMFKDQRNILSIPNFWNVISNLPFLLVGVMGLLSIIPPHSLALNANIKGAYILFFMGVSLVAFGSGYYHLHPGNESLVWDRLPMTIAFMALFSVIIGEFISVQLGKFILWPLIVLGLFSVIYWHSTEINGKGDLRLYILVQFLPLILIPLILIFFKPMFTCTAAYWLMLCAYVLAKVFEHFDEAVYNMLSLSHISGHSMKHLVAAIGVLFLLKGFDKRELQEKLKDESQKRLKIIE